jgi:predicted nucleic acid-binding protein
VKITRKVEKIYVDANVIIEAVRQRFKTPDKMRENDLWVFEKMLQAAEEGELALFTSSVSIAECTHVDGDCDEATQDFFRSFLSAGTLIKLVQDSVFVAEKARDLRWQHDIKLSGMDAIHVASALDAACKEMITFDCGIQDRKLSIESSKIRALGVAVILPSDSTLLPKKYRQGVLPLTSRKTRRKRAVKVH